MGNTIFLQHQYIMSTPEVENYTGKGIAKTAHTFTPHNLRHNDDEDTYFRP